MPAPNERFHASGGVCPQTVLCVLASSPPARAFVSRHPRKAATTLGASGGQLVGLCKRIFDLVEYGLIDCEGNNELDSDGILRIAEN